jgi:hypothetical protein
MRILLRIDSFDLCRSNQCTFVRIRYYAVDDCLDFGSFEAVDWWLELVGVL